MPPIVKLQDVIEALDLQPRESQSYLHRESGAIVLVSDGMAIGPDGEMDPEDVEESDEFLPLPTAFEIDEWSMMRDFARERPASQADELLDTISGRGAFRMFRAALKRLRIEDQCIVSTRKDSRQLREDGWKDTESSTSDRGSALSGQ